MRTFLIALTALLVTLGSFDAATAQTLRLTNQSGLSDSQFPLNTPFTLGVRLESSAVSIFGWRFGVEIDPSLVSIANVLPTPAVETSNNGSPPEFQLIELYPNGFTAEAIVCQAGCPGILAPSFVLYTFDFTGHSLGSATFSFTNTLGTVPIELDTQTATIVPAAVSRVAQIAEHARWEFRLTDETVGIPQPTGEALFSVVGSIGEFPETPPLGYSNTPAFSMAIRHDPAVISGLGVAPIGALAALPGGPDFFGVELHPDGMTVGVVYSFAGLDHLQFVGDTPVVRAEYATVPGAFVNATAASATTVEYSSMLGTSITFVNPGDGASIPFEFPGTITFVPVPPALYVRGDANDDAVVDLGDPIAILAYLFSGGDAPFCLTAADANGDGAVDLGDPIRLLTFLFESGAPPEAPYPDCGYVAFEDCTVAASSCP